MTKSPGTRVEIDGRTFFVGRTTSGILKVTERKVYAPGRPWEHLYDATIYHAGGGRKPTKLIRRILALVPTLETA